MISIRLGLLFSWFDWGYNPIIFKSFFLSVFSFLFLEMGRNSQGNGSFCVKGRKNDLKLIGLKGQSNHEIDWGATNPNLWLGLSLSLSNRIMCVIGIDDWKIWLLSKSAFNIQLIVRKWPFQPDTGRIQKGSKWEIQASTGRIQKGSKWEIQACGTEKKKEKKEGVYHALREWLGAQIALLILDSSFFYDWLYQFFCFLPSPSIPLGAIHIVRTHVRRPLTPRPPQCTLHSFITMAHPPPSPGLRSYYMDGP